MQSSHRMPAAKMVRWTLALILAGLLLRHNASAQIDTLKLTSDELFSLAREKAFAGQREEARGLCRTILVRSPSYSDARILLGRAYAWDGRREEARAEFRRVLQEKPAYKDALLALLDVEIWDEKYDRALAIANEALSSHPSDEDLILKKVRALKGLSRDEEALLVLNKLEDLNPSLAEIATLRKSISSTSMNNGIGINYASDRYSDTYDPMHYAYLQLSRRTALGSLFGRVNYSRRFGSDGLQIETDLYPRFADGVYAYLNYGFQTANSSPGIGPGWRFTPSSLHATKARLDSPASGFGPSSSVSIYTGSLGLYAGSYWLCFRPYFIPNDAGMSKSASLTLGRYLGDAENFLSLKAGAGFSPDERTIQSNTGFQGQTQVFHLQSQTVGIGIQQGIATYHLFVASFDVTNQELSFSPDNYVVMYSLSVGLRVRF